MLKKIWNIWMWLCAVSVLLIAVLALVYGIVIVSGYGSASSKDRAGECIEQGGRWNAEAERCEFPA